MTIDRVCIIHHHLKTYMHEAVALVTNSDFFQSVEKFLGAYSIQETGRLKVECSHFWFSSVELNSVKGPFILCLLMQGCHNPSMQCRKSPAWSWLLELARWSAVSGKLHFRQKQCSHNFATKWLPEILWASHCCLWQHHIRIAATRKQYHVWEWLDLNRFLQFPSRLGVGFQLFRKC